MTKFGAMLLLLAFVGLGGLGGCVDSSKPESPCDLKTVACHNRCYKADLGIACHGCCNDNYASCRSGEKYNFSPCPDAE